MKAGFGPGNWTLEELIELVRPPAKLPKEQPAVVAIVRELVLELKETRELLDAQTKLARGRAELLEELQSRLQEQHSQQQERATP